MRASGGSLGRTVCALALCSLAPTGPVFAAAVLRSAEIIIAVPSEASCDVTMTFLVEGAPTVDHRVEELDGATIARIAVEGAGQSGEPRTIGRTRSLTVTPGQTPYTIRYRVQQPADRTARCPLWLPTTPTDGVSRAVKLQVDLPAGATPGSTMPRFTWTGTRGTVTLAHVPAFVLLPFAAPGQSPGWDVSAVMDAAAVSVFVAASAIWLWRKQGRRGG